MGLLSEVDMTFTLPAMRHPMAVIPTLVILTAHQAGTAMETASATHSCTDRVTRMISHQTK